MKKIIVFSMLCACCILIASAAAPLMPDDFRSCADARGPVKPDALYQVHLTDEIIQGAAPGFEDVRLLGPSGKETPFSIIEHILPAEHVEVYPLEITGFAGDSSSAIISMKLPEKHKPISALDLEITDTDFKKKASISGSGDGKAWKTLTEDTIYDFSSRVNLRKTRIEFKKSAYRYYRLKLTELKAITETQPSLRLKYEGLDFSVNGLKKKELHIHSVEGSTSARKGNEPVYDSKVFAALSPTLDKSGDTVLVLKADLPIDKLFLDVTNPYYYRSMSVYYSDFGKEDSYQFLTQQSVYRFPLSAEQQETRNYIEQRTTKHGYYKIVIVNKNNPPLDMKGITLSWVRKDLYFIALNNAGRYSLCFGNPELTRPDYDIAHFINQNTLLQHAYEKLDTAPARENTAFKQPVSREKKAWLEKMVLRVVVVILVIGMGFWLFTLMKKAGKGK